MSHSDTNPEIRIIADAPVCDMGALLGLLAETAGGMAAPAAAGLTATEIFARLQAREEEKSTALGCGLLFPHARFAGLGKLSIVFVLPAKPFEVEYEPITLVCMMLIPEDHPMAALKFMARVADCVRTRDRGAALAATLRGGDAAQVCALLALDSRKVLCAADLMRDCRLALHPGMPLQEATRCMLAGNAEVVPVLEEGKLVGELSCSELFKLGIPDFFNHLKSVGFIRYYDPFENYFAVESRSVVGDVMNREAETFPPDATLIEIVFAMAVRKLPLIYITGSDGKMLGEIDQAVLLERIINL